MKKAIKTLFMSLALFAIPCMSLVSCSNDEEPDTEPSLAKEYAGTYDGIITLNVGGQYSYDSHIKCIITEGTDETISVTFPEYSLSGTMMGDMTLGQLTISNLVYDDAKGGFYRNYGSEDISQTMNGTAYTLNSPSSILVVKDINGKLTINNSFIMGKMPLPLTVIFTGEK